MGEEKNKDQTPSYDEMEALFVNNEKLEHIEAYLKRFNPIKTMKMEHMEIRHSAILSWLLDPSETHGLGDSFLKSFLGESFRGLNDQRPTALDISQSDLRDAEIRCEWQNIDIFILSPSNGWGFIVENKFHSKQHGNQLKKYREKIEKLFPMLEKEKGIRGVFLTLWDELPEDQSYAPIKYDVICEILERILQQRSNYFSSEVSMFLNHYLDILKDATGRSNQLNEMELLARQLYREHKKVLDFVIEHGASTDFAIAVRSLLEENPKRFKDYNIGKNHFVFNVLGNNIVSFLPLAWYQALGEDSHEWSGCENWWAGFPLITWFHITTDKEGTKGQLRLFAEVGPYVVRDELIKAVQSEAKDKALKNITFQKGATDEGRRYSKFLKNNTVKIQDVHNPEEIMEAMKKLLDKFRPEFKAVTEVLPDLLPS